MLPKNKVDWKDFELDKLVEQLGLSSPPLNETAFRQLRYVEQYANDIKCRSIAIERYYIDRDHIEDHSVFYSKSLYPYENHCQRVHFFSIEKKRAQQKFTQIVNVGVKRGDGDYRKECKKYSEAAYLGFAVIKPLHGCPVGRTVLRTLPETPEEPERANEFRRNFQCTRQYHVHFFGVELSVNGLAFQQQDIGVSACATTAIWTSLQKTSDHEAIRPATPAEITTFAGKYSLPFGRSMPSEGLSLDQMSQAINTLGVAPNLFPVAHDGFLARSYLYSAIKSGLAPILILSNANQWHAVTVAGMKVTPEHVVSPNFIDDAADDLLGLYIHDDRKGPYLRVNFEDCQKERPLYLNIPARSAVPEEPDERWKLTHILIPMHDKIRLSFTGLRRVADGAADIFLRYGSTFEIPEDEYPPPKVTIDTRIMRAHKYIEAVFIGKSGFSAAKVRKLSTSIPLSRYLGIVRVTSSNTDPIDIIVDTTSTWRNVYVLGIVANGTQGHSQYIAQFLAKSLGCQVVE